ncbi:LOW QUALITY PROTEIN: hypothetical protein MXB_2458 [Myxobolus squamalis]|nr:LOW QUALITY PROTEIN: hypothetical protein MXB_2458 [Myxobolus squamalis]
MVLDDVTKSQFHAFLHPYFSNTLKGSIKNCISRALSEQKPLLCVTLENYSDESFEKIKTLFLDPTIEPILRKNFMIWGNSLDHRRESLGITNAGTPDFPESPITLFPHFEIMMKYRAGLEPTDVDTLNAFLNEALEKFKKSSSHHTRISDINQAHSKLMRKQEEEFNESLKKDLIKKFLEFRQNCQCAEADFESSSNQNYITLKVKYPDGFVSHIELSPDQPISVCAYAEFNALYKHIIESKEDLLSNFHIFSSYPKKHLCVFDIFKHHEQHHLSLGEFDLDRSQVLMVEYSSDEE